MSQLLYIGIGMILGLLSTVFLTFTMNLENIRANRRIEELEDLIAAERAKQFVESLSATKRKYDDMKEPNK